MPFKVVRTQDRADDKGNVYRRGFADVTIKKDIETAEEANRVANAAIAEMVAIIKTRFKADKSGWHGARYILVAEGLVSSYESYVFEIVMT